MERNLMIKRSMLFCCAAALFSMGAPGAEASFSSKCQATIGSGQPTGLALDGTHGTTWVAFFQGNYVAEIRWNDCVVLTKVQTQANPNDVVFDGAYIWVTNYGSSTVQKIDTNLGVVAQTIAVGAGPRGIAFDGSNIWVANSLSNTVTKLQASTGTNLGTFAVGSAPYFLAVNPADNTIWVPNLNSNNVSVLNQSGALLRTIPTDTQPVYITGNGDMWVSCYNSAKIDRFSSSGTLLARISAPHSAPLGLTVDTSHGLIWGVTFSGYLYSIDISTNVVGNVAFRGGSSHGQYDVKWGGPTDGDLWMTDETGGTVSDVLFF
jgi:YVTN family beta-propeller protein